MTKSLFKSLIFWAVFLLRLLVQRYETDARQLCNSSTVVSLFTFEILHAKLYLCIIWLVYHRSRPHI